MGESQRRIEIDFERGPHIEEDLRQSRFDAMVPISIEVGGQSVTELISHSYIDVFIWLFWSACLSDMEQYESSNRIDIGIDSASLFIESDGDTIELYLYLPSSGESPEQYGDRLTVSLKEFVAELIVTAEEFIEYVLDACPEYTEEDVKSTKDDIADARYWYEQKYDEQV